MRHRKPLNLIKPLFFAVVAVGVALFQIQDATGQISHIQTEPNATYQVAFSPNAGSLKLVIDSIDGAKQQILVAAYGFTSKPIATALVDAAKRGVEVRVIGDAKEAANGYSALNFLASHKVAVRVNDKYKIFHHKFMVIDQRHLETGSFNYTQNAVKGNAENVIVLRDAPNVIAPYKTEWVRLWNESTDLTSRY
jgi:phosphatidylserine/phosphatidylglycerophosphate/cardiolipin synthase-like enzyme